MQDDMPPLEGRAAGEDPQPRSSPSGSGRSNLQCDIHRKHARKGQEPCRVCAKAGPEWAYACLRCGVRLCSAACKNVALSARICGQDVRLVMSPQDRAVEEVAQSVSISLHIVTQDRDFQPMHVDDDDRTQLMLERVTDSPVLPTARLKPDLEARFIALLRDAMAQHAGAEELAEKRPSREARLRAATAGRWLWVLKGLMAFVLTKDENMPEVNSNEDNEMPKFTVLDDYEEMMKGRQKELNSLKEMCTMTVVKRTEAVGKRTIQTRWVDREKDGKVKSRLVLKDCNRCQERTQPEMFSPTPSTLSLKTMLAASSHEGQPV